MRAPMKKTKILCVVWITVVLEAFLSELAWCQGTVYYVAPTGGGGSDSNPGTIDQPWATLTHATLSAHAAHMLSLRGGTSTNTAPPSNPDNAIGNEGTSGGTCQYGMCNGTAANPITFGAYPGEKPLISNGTGTAHRN